MRGLYEHSSADFLRRADSLCNTVEYQWVIADAPPTIDNGAKPRNPQAFSWVHEAFETMSMTRRQAAIPPLQFLFHFLWVFGDFFDADDPTDREGKYYIEFGVSRTFRSCRRSTKFLALGETLQRPHRRPLSPFSAVKAGKHETRRCDLFLRSLPRSRTRESDQLSSKLGLARVA